VERAGAGFKPQLPRLAAQDQADGFAAVFGGGPGGEVAAAAMDEIGGEAAIKAPGGIGGEGGGGAAGGRGVHSPLFQQWIQLLAVKSDDIFHVGGILKPAFDLEGGDPGIKQLAELSGEIEVTQGEEVPAAADRFSGTVDKAVRQAAGLGALAAVAAAAAAGEAEIALATVGDAEGAVHETLQFDPA